MNFSVKGKRIDIIGELGEGAGWVWAWEQEDRVGRGWGKGVLEDFKFSMWIVFGLWNFGK